MSRRYKMSKRSSRSSFSRGASRIHRKNYLSGATSVARGGIRL